MSYTEEMMAMIDRELKPVLAERDALFEDNARLSKWISDLQSGMYVNCVYCGHRYGPHSTTPVSMADALKAHIEECPKHPMSELKRLFLLTRSALRGLLPEGWDDGVMDHMRGVKAARLALEGSEPDLYMCEECYQVSDKAPCKWCGEKP